MKTVYINMGTKMVWCRYKVMRRYSANPRAIYCGMRAFRALKANEALVALPGNTGNAIVILNIADCNRKIGALLECQAFRKLKKDSNESVECKTFLLKKKSAISDEVYQKRLPQVSRPQKLYVLPKIRKEVSLS
jgi:hypothetical protein